MITIKHPILDEEELKEFTFLNLMAFDVSRALANKNKTGLPPVWLCRSEEAREADRLVALQHLKKLPGVHCTRDNVEEVLATFAQAVTGLDLWMQFEAYMKTERKAGNPRAFFCPGGRCS